MDTTRQSLSSTDSIEGSQRIDIPKSPTNGLINLTGVFGFGIAILLIRSYGDRLSIGEVSGTLLCIVAYALPIVILELGFLKSFRASSTGIDFTKPRNPSLARTATKYLGLVLTVSFLGLIYWLFPEYWGSFYERYYYMAFMVVPVLLMLAIPYFYVIDQCMTEPRDGYWHMGMLVVDRSQVDRRVVWQHIRGWIVKGFFLPLMFIFLSDDLSFLITIPSAEIFSTYQSAWVFLRTSIFSLDLLIAAAGYLLTIRLLDSHIRSTEPTFLGWFVALECYQPFWSFSSGRYLHYDTGTGWENWFTPNTPTYIIWGTVIIILMIIYVWSSLTFGIRFSNLTNRGILTNGPYRFCKHPAYVSKNISWWLISMPFMVVSSIDEALRHSLLLLGVNFIYFLRARTEERHLSQDPTYVQYAEHMNEHSVFAWVGHWIPELKFKPGHLFNFKPQLIGVSVEEQPSARN